MRAGSSINAGQVRFMNQLKQLLFGANSKTETRTEQLELRTTIKSLEVTVETDEVVQIRWGTDSLNMQKSEAVGPVRRAPEASVIRDTWRLS